METTLTEDLINLIESRSILDALTGGDFKCDTIINENAVIILCNKVRMTIIDDMFILMNIKLPRKLGKKATHKICNGLCRKLEHRPCTYNRKEFINIITLINIEEQREYLLKIIEHFINLI